MHASHGNGRLPRAYHVHTCDDSAGEILGREGNLPSSGLRDWKRLRTVYPVQVDDKGSLVIQQLADDGVGAKISDMSDPHGY